jgi:hypothetical protein
MGPATMRGTIIDRVLDFDAAAGRNHTTSAADVIAYVRACGITIEWLLETHVD